MSKLSNRVGRFGLLVGGLIILTLATTLAGLWQYQGELASQTQAGRATLVKSSAAAAHGPVGGTAPVAAPADPGSPAVAQLPGQTAEQDSTSAPAAAQPAPAAAPAVVSLSLSINGQAKGTVRLSAGSTQCVVLSQALSDGLIANLDMRYSSQYGTEGVYVINGMGDPNSVWWTYTVNGHAPPYGCAYVTAHDGDSVNWQYLKS